MQNIYYWLSKVHEKSILAFGGIPNTLLVAMAKKNNVYLRGFGSFVVKKRAAKIARNITKNTTIVVPAHDTPTFKPAKSFTAKVK